MTPGPKLEGDGRGRHLVEQQPHRSSAAWSESHAACASDACNSCPGSKCRCHRYGSLSGTGPPAPIRPAYRRMRQRPGVPVVVADRRDDVPDVEAAAEEPSSRPPTPQPEGGGEPRAPGSVLGGLGVALSEPDGAECDDDRDECAEDPETAPCGKVRAGVEGAGRGGVGGVDGEVGVDVVADAGR